MKMVVTIDLKRVSVPNRTELEDMGFDTLEEYMKEKLSLNPQPLLREAQVEIEED